MTFKLHDIEKTYQVVRMKFVGFSIAIPHRTDDDGISCRTIPYEVIDFGGKRYKCAKDHDNRVIYIDTHAVEEAVESSS